MLVPDNVAEPDVIVYFILGGKSVIVFARLLDPSATIRLVLGDVFSHESFNLQLTEGVSAVVTVRSRSIGGNESLKHGFGLELELIKS